jgi:hypothetical protein
MHRLKSSSLRASTNLLTSPGWIRVKPLPQLDELSVIYKQADIFSNLYWSDAHKSFWFGFCDMLAGWYFQSLTKSLSMSFPLCTCRLIFSIFVIEIAEWLYWATAYHVLLIVFPLEDPG